MIVALALGVLGALSAVPAVAGASFGPIREVKLADEAHAVALSANGTTGLTGGREPNGGKGAGVASVMRRSHGTWALQGGPFIFPEATAQSVAISADGNTALVGLPFGEGSYAAEWGRVAVLTRIRSTWTEQEILNNPEQGNTGRFGASVALSADGTTALILSNENYEQPPAGTRSTVYVYAREGLAWRQQGKPLAFHTESPDSTSVALSADGNTVLVDVNRQWFAPGEYEPIKAAWVFTRSGSGWARQELRPPTGEEVGEETFQESGRSVALSSDGTTALLGDLYDNHGIGAAWVFKRTGSIWTQEGPKLAGREEVGTEGFAGSVALSANGSTALIGSAPCGGDTCGGKFHGAVWVFKRKGSKWRQQAPPLACSGCKNIGLRVALSGNARTALVSVLP